jgi:hypothetical protein
MVMSGFRYAKHFDESLKRKSVGYQPSCPPGLISQAKIYLARTILTFSDWLRDIPRPPLLTTKALMNMNRDLKN